MPPPLCGDITRQLRRMHRNIAHERKKPVAVHPPVVLLSWKNQCCVRLIAAACRFLADRPVNSTLSTAPPMRWRTDNRHAPPVLCLSPMWMTPAKKVPTQSATKWREMSFPRSWKHRVFARHEQAVINGML